MFTKNCNKTMPFTKSKIQSNLSSLRARKEQDVDLGFSCFPRIYLILFSASSIGKVSGSRLLHSGPDKLLKLKCAAAQSSLETNNYTMYCIQPIQMHLLQIDIRRLCFTDNGSKDGIEERFRLQENGGDVVNNKMPIHLRI